MKKRRPFHAGRSPGREPLTDADARGAGDPFQGQTGSRGPSRWAGSRKPYGRVTPSPADPAVPGSYDLGGGD